VVPSGRRNLHDHVTLTRLENKVSQRLLFHFICFCHYRSLIPHFIMTKVASISTSSNPKTHDTYRYLRPPQISSMVPHIKRHDSSMLPPCHAILDGSTIPPQLGDLCDAVRDIEQSFLSMALKFPPLAVLVVSTSSCCDPR
jgi:hypothetical protein